MFVNDGLRSLLSQNQTSTSSIRIIHLYQAKSVTSRACELLQKRKLHQKQAIQSRIWNDTFPLHNQQNFQRTAPRCSQ